MNNRRTLIKRLLVTCGIVAWVGGMVLGYLSEGPWRTVGFALHIAASLWFSRHASTTRRSYRARSNPAPVVAERFSDGVRR